jgi:hypothetical protein
VGVERGVESGTDLLGRGVLLTSDSLDHTGGLLVPGSARDALELLVAAGFQELDRVVLDRVHIGQFAPSTISPCRACS